MGEGGGGGVGEGGGGGVGEGGGGGVGEGGGGGGGGVVTCWKRLATEFVQEVWPPPFHQNLKAAPPTHWPK